jgi:hypothetical protein
LRNLLARLSRVDVLIVDDWAMAPMQETERRDFWEICDERYQMRSTILTSQLLENRKPQGSPKKTTAEPSLRSGQFRSAPCLTIPITSATITTPASLRSDP